MQRSQLHSDQRTTVVAILGMLAMLNTGFVSGETFTGRLNGLRCAEDGQFCPVENLDAHLSFEQDFVLQQADGEYYFLSNVPRDTKVRHVRKKVKVIGTVIELYRSISVESLLVDGADGYREVWSPAAQLKAFDQIFSSGWQDGSTTSEQLGELR
ncbi:MAG: hypothetical protein GVY22_02315 [Gammaproteobacteria bacterium]|jgi:hypothetical protein|nr:hypothetical protein [Gammaproteobacteria bacterium]